jgi:tetratricopeptide (TPR) repeat protein
MHMSSVSKLALGAAIALAAAAIMPAGPATAQAPAISLTQAERMTLLALKTAFDSGNMTAASAALTAARAAATGAQARHSVAEYQYQIAVRNNDYRAQTDALTALVASGRIPASQVPAIQAQIGSVAYNHIRDYGLAERAFTAQVAAAPNSAEGMVNLARVKLDLKKPQEAQPLLVRAIQAHSASGQRAPESWYKMALDLAFKNKNGAQVAAVGPSFVAAYPTPQNWRDVLLMQRELQPADPAASLDLYRLMRASKGLGGERDYFDMASALEAAGSSTEAKAVLEEGASSRMIDTAKGTARDLLTRSSAGAVKERAALAGLQSRAASDATGTSALKAADALLGRGDYAKAAELYRTALQKGSVDAGLANTRLGMALALAGQRAEAEAALRAVTGPRSQMAAYWLAWLGGSA